MSRPAADLQPWHARRCTARCRAAATAISPLPSPHCRKNTTRVSVQVKTPVGHTLWDAEHLLAKAGGKAPATMTSFQALIRKMPKPPKPTDAPKAVPAPPEDLGAVKQWLWGDSGRVPSAGDLKLDLGNGGQGSPFHVRRRRPRHLCSPAVSHLPYLSTPLRVARSLQHALLLFVFARSPTGHGMAGVEHDLGLDRGSEEVGGAAAGPRDRGARALLLHAATPPS